MKRVVSLLLCYLVIVFSSVSFAETIKIGFDIPLSGENQQTGKSAKDAAELIKNRINAQGGLVLGGKRYMLEFIYEDNKFDPEVAKKVALKLIDKDKVWAIVGPMASRQAVPTGGVCNQKKTLMISPWSTNPKTTINRPWVFRAAFLDPFQSEVALSFSNKTLPESKSKKTVGIIYVSDDYSKDLAALFKLDWEDVYGEGSVIVFDSFVTGEDKFLNLARRLVSANPDMIFLPCHYYQVAKLVKDLKKLGWNKPIFGSDSWGSADLFPLCGSACVGYYFSTHYAALGAKGKNKQFVDLFKRTYGYLPDDPAALTWDSLNLLLTALKNAEDLLGNDLEKNKSILRFALSKIRNFEGVTGKMHFTYQGDPVKCAVVVQINNKGQFVFKDSICPK